jgi:hypothetical protein
LLEQIGKINADDIKVYVDISTEETFDANEGDGGIYGDYYYDNYAKVKECVCFHFIYKRQIIPYELIISYQEFMVRGSSQNAGFYDDLCGAGEKDYDKTFYEADKNFIFFKAKKKFIAFRGNVDDVIVSFN